MTRTEVKETDIAAAVVAWLVDMGWDVYQEVEVGGPVIDIVATKGPLIWAIECKVSMSLALIEQAFVHLRYANYVSVVCREHKAKRDFFVRSLLKDYGIGLFEVSEGYEYDQESGETLHPWTADHEIEPKLNRKIGDIFGIEPGETRFGKRKMLREFLHEGHKRCAAAGSAKGGRWTPFKETCRGVLGFVLAHPGCTPKECFGDVSHHYTKDSTARSSMIHWIRGGKVPGVEERMDGSHVRWWPTDPNIKEDDL